MQQVQIDRIEKLLKQLVEYMKPAKCLTCNGTGTLPRVSASLGNVCTACQGKGH
ncbi:MAG: hypothetical protein KAS32_28970 [Candidatus Peribacteraceae bacterium]|nr:hypothetical protein [Candidatus Peribacteraceae bacterium]